jgi:hypothetical protein
MEHVKTASGETMPAAALYKMWVLKMCSKIDLTDENNNDGDASPPHHHCLLLKLLGLI